ncbi:hypothetical protein HMPREF0345_0830 [Enterococcus faecalis ATCC 29200]|nr:hypothetical protein HMPREF0345_0830 [Enterococcus faecalis ATCC 29200]
MSIYIGFGTILNNMTLKPSDGAGWSAMSFGTILNNMTLKPTLRQFPDN